MKFHLRVAPVFAEFLVDKCADEDYIRKKIEPEHQDDNRGKGAIDRGIFYRGAYEPGEKSAEDSENKRTENRPRKNFHSVRASPCVAEINSIKKRRRNNVENNKTQPVPEVCNGVETDEIQLEEKRFQKIEKPSSAENDDCKNINCNKEKNRIDKAEKESCGFVSASAFKNLPKGIRKGPESGSTGENRRYDSYEKQSAGLGTGICEVILNYSENAGGNNFRKTFEKKNDIFAESAKNPLHADEHRKKRHNKVIRKRRRGAVEAMGKEFFGNTDDSLY